MSQPAFTLPYLILVEGPADKAFLSHLLVDRGILARFDIRHPKEAGLTGSGNSRFGEALDAFAVVPGFDHLRGILLISDNDEDPAAAFLAVQQQIAGTARKHPVPQAPLTTTTGNPPITVMMIPWLDEQGNLETLCLPAAEAAHPKLAACADEFQRCTETDQWPATKRAKLKLRSIIAAEHRRNPDLSLTFLWDDCHHLIPLSDSCFDRIAAFLSGFETASQGA